MYFLFSYSIDSDDQSSDEFVNSFDSINNIKNHLIDFINKNISSDFSFNNIFEITDDKFKHIFRFEISDFIKWEYDSENEENLIRIFLIDDFINVFKLKNFCD